MKTLTTEQMEDALERGEALVINVLARQEFERAHIPGSENIPIHDDDFLDRVDSLLGDRDAPLVVYCAGPDCDASPSAARRLEEAGFTDVYAYEGGMAHWMAAGNEVERGAAAEVR